MPTPEALAALLRLCVEQEKALRETRLQLEALKAMMFEHRPPFHAEFERHLDGVRASAHAREFDDRIRRLESMVQTLSS